MFYWLASLLLVIPLLKLFDRFLRSYDSIPGPPRWPIIGNLAQFMGVGAVEIFALLADYSNRYGGIYKLDFLFDYTIVYSTPEAAELILKSSNFTSKSEDYQKVAEWIGDGLLMSRGYKWLTHRRVIAPGFNARVLERFVPVFSRHAETFCAKLEALMIAQPDEPINVLPELKLHALGVLCETAMGVTSDEEQEKQRTYTQAVEELNSILYWRMFDSFGTIDVLFRLTPTSRRFNELVATSRSFTHDMIDRRRKMKEKNRKGFIVE
ncbi:AGAP002416-PA-like protein [Anopheles sinensis]|uniref:AGAP002416-PA-like protein n=1 Tax=Anopheles sinensis TaxID=74873 RepID=A0A084VSE7_ANOSI|nr:AGAP002416-PA-like protein [Anopheles sinensis]